MTETTRTIADWSARHRYAPASDIDLVYRIRDHVAAAQHLGKTLRFEARSDGPPLVADALVLLAVLCARRNVRFPFVALLPDVGLKPVDTALTNLATAVSRDLLTCGEWIAAVGANLLAMAGSAGQQPQAMVDAHMARMRVATGDPLPPPVDRGGLALGVLTAAGPLLDEVQRQARELAGRKRLAPHVARSQPITLRINGAVVLDTAAALAQLQETDR